MKYKIFPSAAILLAALACFCLCGCRTSEKAPDLIVIDFSLDYPVLDLKLPDIAEISYIPLQGKDSARVLSLATALPNNIYIGSEHIFIGDFAPYRKDGEWHRFSPQSGSLMLFGCNGEYLNTVFRSKNEGEDILFGLNAPYAVFPKKKEIYAFSAYGKFIRGFKYNGETISTGPNIGTKYKECIVSGDTIAWLLHRRQNFKILCHNVCTGETAPIQTHTFSRPFDNDVLMTGHHITVTGTGAYITTPGTDTIYHLNRNMEIVPKLYNVRHTEDADNLACPLVETDEYILLCNIQDSQSRHDKRFRNANYIYLKGEKQMYRLPWEGESILNEHNTTLTPNTIAIALPISQLKENYNLLPDDLKRITDASAEDDNPVLMIMRFGKQLPKVSSLVQ